MLAVFGCAPTESTDESPEPGSALALRSRAVSGTLVFQSDRSGNWDIYRLSFTAEDSRLVRLTDDPAADRNPSWSPDGRRIAFSSERTGAGDIYTMRADGDDLRRVTDHPAYEGAPRFSPDGTAIVFEAERDGRAEIYIVPAEGGRVRQVTSSITRKLGPALSPDGSELAFMEKTLVRWQVAVREWRGEKRKRTVTRGGGACRPAWSPDGALLAYVGTSESPKADIWFREMRGPREGNAWRVPTRPNAHNYDPAFSPDGASLAMASTLVRGDAEQWDIFLVDINGRGLVALTGSEGNERFPDWRPRE